MFYLFASCSTDSETPPPVLPLVTKLLISQPQDHWAALVTLMSLKQVDKLTHWLSKRLIIETNAQQNPSFELLCVMLWLNDKEQLTKICEPELLAQYLATRQEADQFGNTVWHFANVGLGAEFINKGIENGYLLAPRNGLCQKTTFPKCIKPITSEQWLLESHIACYSGNPQTIDKYLLNNSFARGIELFVALGRIGSWQGLLVGIVRGFYDNVESEWLELISFKNSHPKMRAIASYWHQLFHAPRSESIAGKINLSSLLESTEHPDICYAYLVYNFMLKPQLATTDYKDLVTKKNSVTLNGETTTNVSIVSCKKIPVYTTPSAFYGVMLNEFLKKTFAGNAPQLQVLELFIYSPKAVIDSLAKETKDLMRQVTTQYYPNVVPHVFAESAQQLPSADNSRLAAYAF